jgi:hypothetical protein
MAETAAVVIMGGIMLIFLGYMGLLVWWTYLETR